MRCSWDDVTRGTALEFLNVICYAKDKAAHREAEIKKFKAKN